MRVFALGVCTAVALVGCGGAVDGDSTGAGRSPATGANGDPSSSGTGTSTSSSSSSGSAPPIGVRPACAISAPIREGFDTGIAEGWGAANPGGLSFDETQPIHGTKSLKINLASPLLGLKRAYLTHTVPSSCAARLTINVRMAAPLFGAEQTAILVRLSAAPTFFDVVLGANGLVTLQESASNPVEEHPIGTLTADTPTAIVIDFDLQANQAVTTMNALGSPVGSPTKNTLLLGHGQIVNVAVGVFLATASTGTYWLDDFALE